MCLCALNFTMKFENNKYSTFDLSFLRHNQLQFDVYLFLLQYIRTYKFILNVAFSLLFMPYSINVYDFIFILYDVCVRARVFKHTMKLYFCFKNARNIMLSKLSHVYLFALKKLSYFCYHIYQFQFYLCTFFHQFFYSIDVFISSTINVIPIYCYSYLLALNGLI